MIPHNKRTRSEDDERLFVNPKSQASTALLYQHDIMKNSQKRFPAIAWSLFMILTSATVGRPGELFELNPVPQPPADHVIAIVGARLIDGRGEAPVNDAVVVVRDSRIEAAGPRGKIRIPAGAKRFDATGLTLLPGLIDAHLHAGKRPELPPIFLRAGVTAARDPGVGLDQYNAAIQRGKRIPRMFLTGEHLDQEPPAHPSNAIIVNTVAEAKAVVNRFADQGATAIKVYFRLPPELIRATCEAADARGIPVVAHLELVDADVAIQAGIDGLEHVSSVGTAIAEPSAAEAFRTAVDAENKARLSWRYKLWAGIDLKSPRVARMVKMLARHDVVMSPTLTYFFGHGPGSKQPTEEHRQAFTRMLGFVQKCHEAGVSVVVGSHTMLNVEPDGKAYQKEMELLVDAGMSPMDVIVAATLEGAKFLRAEKRIGSVEPGKLADLVLIESDPLQDIRAMRNVRRVMLNGLWTDEMSAP